MQNSAVFDKLYGVPKKSGDSRPPILTPGRKAFASVLALMVASGVLTYFRQGNPILVVALGGMWGLVAGAVTSKLFPAQVHGLLAGIMAGSNLSGGTGLGVPAMAETLSGVIALRFVPQVDIGVLTFDVTTALYSALAVFGLVSALALFFEKR